jgi:hypothetical protein
MSQSTYDLFLGPLQAGDLESTRHEVVANQKAAVDIIAGLGVVANAAGAAGQNLVAVPSGVGRRFRGVALTRQFRASSSGAGLDLTYKAGDQVPVVEMGRVVISVVGAVNPDSQVFLRLTGADAGKFSAGPAVAGTDFLIANASFESSTSGAGVAVLNLHGAGPRITA